MYILCTHNDQVHIDHNHRKRKDLHIKWLYTYIYVHTPTLLSRIIACIINKYIHTNMRFRRYIPIHLCPYQAKRLLAPHTASQDIILQWH